MVGITPQLASARGRLIQSAAGVWYLHTLDPWGRKVQFAIGRHREVPISPQVTDTTCLVELRHCDAPWRLSPISGRGESVVPNAIHVGGGRITVATRQDKAVAALRRFLTRAVPPSEHALAPGDLGSAQRVVDYRSHEAQRRYAHMYAAKSIGLWRAVRDQLGWRCEHRRALVSVGAGPRLDLMGWSFDTQWAGPVLAADPLPWEGVLSDPAWRLATGWLVGEVCDLGRRFVPPGAEPPQLSGLLDLMPLTAEAIPDGATVLMPFMANHLLDAARNPHAPSFAALGSWLTDLTRRGCRIVIADMGRGPGHLWPAVLRAVGARRLTPRTYRFDEAIHALGALYPDAHASYRSGRHYPAMCAARVLVFDGAWRFLTR